MTFNNEIVLINKFCESFGLEYGEIDVVRDFSSGNIYILDVNKTPWGPPNGLSISTQNIAVRLYKKYFLYLIKLKTAQQVDTPEPATGADPVSQTPLPPAR